MFLQSFTWTKFKLFFTTTRLSPTYLPVGHPTMALKAPLQIAKRPPFPYSYPKIHYDIQPYRCLPCVVEEYIERCKPSKYL